MNNKIWEKPIVEDLGIASELILGFTDADPKSATRPDDNLVTGFSAGTV